MRRKSCILLAVGLLGGCAAASVPDVRDQMVGISEGQLSSCMGPPAAKQAEGSTEVWIYYGDKATHAPPLDMGSPALPSAEPTSETGDGACRVTVKLERAKVMTVDYDNLSPERGNEECAEAIQRCAR